MSKRSIDEQAIASRAYEIYLANGRQEGTAEADWAEAEAELLATSSDDDGPQGDPGERHDGEAMSATDQTPPVDSDARNSAGGKNPAPTKSKYRGASADKRQG